MAGERAVLEDKRGRGGEGGEGGEGGSTIFLLTRRESLMVPRLFST